MGDLLYTIKDFGVFKTVASLIVIFLFITAFTHGGKNGGGGGSSSGGGGGSAPPPASPPPTPPTPPA